MRKILILLALCVTGCTSATAPPPVEDGVWIDGTITETCEELVLDLCPED